MAVVKNQSDGVAADRPHIRNPYPRIIGQGCDRSVAPVRSAWRARAKIGSREIKTCAIVEMDDQPCAAVY